VLILRSEDLYIQTALTYQKVLDFLCLPSFTPKQFGRHSVVKSSFEPKLEGESRRKLIEHFRQDNQSCTPS